MSDPRLYAPATERNREAILAVLRRHLPVSGLVLEVASGTGEHAAFFAAALPMLTFQPTDPNPERRQSIDAWTAGIPGVRPALALDASDPDWPVDRADAVLCINMIHIAPWPATPGLFAGAARVLPSGGKLILYGPFRRLGVPLEPSNAEFDAKLREQDPSWGLRALEEVAAAAATHGFGPPVTEVMPANNLSVVFAAL